MDLLFGCLKAFFVGGFICMIGQILIDFTRLTPARILVAYVVGGQSSSMFNGPNSMMKNNNQFSNAQTNPMMAFQMNGVSGF